MKKRRKQKRIILWDEAPAILAGYPAKIAALRPYGARFPKVRS